MGALLGIGLVVLVVGFGIGFMGPDRPWALGVGNVAASACEQAEESNNLAGWFQGIGAVISGLAAVGMLFKK
jgi:F0F1-type ATP synthase membrane subunit c/vacuolar-type H+-ATPase subunit K